MTFTGFTPHPKQREIIQSIIQSDAKYHIASIRRQFGKSLMGMDLEPVYENDGADEGVVTVNGAVLLVLIAPPKFLSVLVIVFSKNFKGKIKRYS